jgi:hypothetical protein
MARRGTKTRSGKLPGRNEAMKSAVISQRRPTVTA